MTFPFPVFATGSKSPFSFATAGAPITGSSVTSLNGFNFGAADPDLDAIILLAAQQGSGVTLASATIGGVAATIDSNVAIVGAGASIAAILRARIPAGGAANLVCTFSGGTVSRLYGDPYRMVNGILVQGARTGSNGSGTSVSISGGIDNGDGGYVVAVGAGNQGSIGQFTWTGLTELTDQTYGANANGRASSAWLANVAATVARAVSFSTGTGSSTLALAGASYGPA